MNATLTISGWSNGSSLRAALERPEHSRRELPSLLRGWCDSWRRCVLASAAAADAPSPPIAAVVDSADWADVRASRDGDGEAYARLVQRHQPAIAAYMWRFTRDRQAWEELVHDVFVEAYFSLANYAGRAPLIHWLKRIATRVGYRFWRRRGRQQREVTLSAELGQTLAAAEGEDAAREAGELVHQLLAQLSPRDRLVLTLVYLEACTTAEAAQLTGWSETLVKVQSHRARQRLAQICEQQGIEL